MISLSYSITPTSREILASIDRTRMDVSSLVIAPTALRTLAWEAMINRIQASHSLTGESLPVKTISSVLSGTTRPTNDRERLLDNYRHQLLLLTEQWTGSTVPFTWQAVEKILTGLQKNIKSRRPWAYQTGKNSEESINWISQLDEHPVVSSALVYGVIASQSTVFEPHPVASLCASAVLSKTGLTVGGLLVLEEGLAKIPEEIEDGMNAIVGNGNYTAWIEHWINLIDRQIRAVVRQLQIAKQVTVPAFFTLPDRERQILGMGDAPGVRLTNRKVAARFGISQITASRALSHLRNLGLLMSHGRGRSVYYTKL